MSAADLVGRALKNGDLEFFVDQLPDDLSGQPLSLSTEAARREAYINLVREIVATLSQKLSRTELHTLFAAQAGNVPPDGKKFSHYLRFHGIKVGRVRVGEHTAAGVYVDWKYDPAWLEETRTWLTSTTKEPLLKKSA